MRQANKCTPGDRALPRLGGTRSLCSCSSLVCAYGGRQGAEPTVLSQRADLPQDPVPASLSSPPSSSPSCPRQQGTESKSGEGL